MQGAPVLAPVQWLGLVLVILGEALRKAGILTARRHFTHTVQTTRRPGHTLVTHGVYAFVRHPGYLGWFIWAVSTQARRHGSWRRSAFGAPHASLALTAFAAKPSVHTWVRRRIVAVRAPSRIYRSSAPFCAYVHSLHYRMLPAGIFSDAFTSRKRA